MTSTTLRLSCIALAAFASAFATASTSAYTISLTGGNSGGNPGGQPLYKVSGLVQGDTFNVAWGGVSGLTATATVSIESLTASTADIRVMLDNLSTPISSSNPRVTAVGMLIDEFTSFITTATGGTDLDLGSTGVFPGFNGIVNACATSGPNCAGGGAGGVAPAASDDFTFQVNGNFGGVLTLANFALKIQGGPNGPGGDSYELAAIASPEPTSLALLAIATAALAWIRRP